MIATDLPEPVVPATSKCGIEDNSATTAEPLMSFPKATVSGLFESSYSVLDITSLNSTGCLSSLGTSTPIVSLPSITSTILTLVFERERAKSLLIFEI